MAYSSIVKPTDYFNTVLYTGNGSTQSITGVNFQPDWVWIKNRTEDYEHTIFDSVRGVQKFIRSSTTGAEATNSNSLTAFGTDGFSIGTESAVNDNSDSFVSWNWLASNTTASNSDGSITSTVSANTTAGFSIVTYSGNSTAGATVGHGLGATPGMIIVKGRDATIDWNVYHHKNTSAPETDYLKLNSTDATTDSSARWNDTAPTSSVFSLGTQTGVNAGFNYVAYCFAEKKGYSKFGSYEGTGNANGTFVYTGFKPAWVLLKISSGTTGAWTLFDNKRDPFNEVDNRLFPDSSGVEADGNDCDFLSNGFKHRTTGSGTNGSGYSYIYMAFAENSFVANDSGTAVPVVAR
jgi:hypothetical protein